MFKSITHSYHSIGFFLAALTTSVVLQATIGLEYRVYNVTEDADSGKSVEVGVSLELRSTMTKL